MMQLIPRRRGVDVALLLLALAATAGAQGGARCDRVATTTFSFGRDGGNIRPQSMQLLGDGTVTAASTDATAPAPPVRVRTVAPEVVRGLARLAWTGGFARLPARPAHPTWNKDAAHQFIDVRSGCGHHRVEWAGDGAPAAFRELWALLDLVGGAGPG